MPVRVARNELQELVNRSSLVVREKKLTKEKLIQLLVSADAGKRDTTACDAAAALSACRTSVDTGTRPVPFKSDVIHYTTLSDVVLVHADVLILLWQRC